MRLSRSRPLAALLAAWMLAGCGPRVKEPLLFPADRKYAGWVGQPAGPIQFKATDGRKVDLDKLRGKVVLLDFWATWCGPCLKELPQLKAAYAEFHAKGFEIIGFSFDHDRETLAKTVQQEQIPWPQYLPPGADNEFGRRFGIAHFPSLWLVDRNGVVRYISAGADLKAKIQALLGETAAAPAAAGAPPARPAGAQHLKLNGFAGRKSDPLVMLNTGGGFYTFGVDEVQLVQTPNGSLKVRCVSIAGKTARFRLGDTGYEMELRVY